MLSRKKQKVPRKKETWENISKSVSSYFILWQTKWPKLLQKTKQLSGKGRVLGLILFCAIAGSYCIYTGTRSFSGMQTLPFSVGSIEQPKYIRPSDDEETTNSFSISKEKYQRIHKFKLFMDSLAMADGPSGKDLFDSITTARPGLMDSILMIENKYQLQTKK